MKVQNTTPQASFKGIIKCRASEQVNELIDKINTKYMVNASFVPLPIGDELNLLFKNPRVETEALNWFKEKSIPNVYLNKPHNKMSIRDIARFVKVPIIPAMKISKESKIVGAIKIMGNTEDHKLLQSALQRRGLTDNLSYTFSTKVDNKGEVNIPLFENVKAYILKVVSSSKDPDYVYYDKPLSVNEFSDFAKKSIYG